ncbi:unnamed protein product [Rotaria sp. Silwood1]|nr:unnamed protein product [Rotaria sp. Silwood1]CAF1359379.1 unnamed protein product [Rotaria sp. Silwood1]CAF3538175.1 unnamed protein product [Rotaria sp. Silwood1]
MKKETSDVICHSLKICRTDPGQPECRLYQPKSSSPSSISLEQRGLNLRQNHPSLLPLLSSKICTIPGIDEICKILEHVFQNHVPLVDIDGDRFGTESTFRGSSWRGKDCNDLSSKIRPGARSVKGDFVIDHNCNGIFGMDSSTNRPWEDELCNDTQQIGVAILGDSVSAHFHIPEQWLDASQASSSVFEHMLFIIENELDWPQLSGSTGYLNISWPNIAGEQKKTIR